MRPVNLNPKNIQESEFVSDKQLSISIKNKKMKVYNQFTDKFNEAII